MIQCASLLSLFHVSYHGGYALCQYLCPHLQSILENGGRKEDRLQSYGRANIVNKRLSIDIMEYNYMYGTGHRVVVGLWGTGYGVRVQDATTLWCVYLRCTPGQTSSGPFIKQQRSIQLPGSTYLHNESPFSENLDVTSSQLDGPVCRGGSGILKGWFRVLVIFNLKGRS